MSLRTSLFSNLQPSPRASSLLAALPARGLLAKKLVVALILAAGSSLAGAQAPQPVASSAAGVPTIESASLASTMHVPVGRSVVLTSASPLRRIYVGNPSVVQSYTSGQREVVITAKAAGISSLVLWDQSGGHRLYTVSADLDQDSLRASLDEALPGAGVRADVSGSKIVLSGTVLSDAVADAAFKLASLYTKDVVNSLRVSAAPHGKQVELKLRIVEVDRTRLEQLGINFFTSGKNTTVTGTQQFGTTTITPAPSGGGIITLTDPLSLLFFNASVGAGVNVQDLEQKQILQVLAEPTLTTMSGLPARFLSGGEFPFPVVQGGTGSAVAVTIVFKPYGVKVDFTPTVNPDGSIHLKVTPEVSTLDYSNAVTISGFTVPALSTRRADTEVEIEDGQSFVVSGLLDHRVTDNINKLPGFGDIPLLGQVFRSKSFQHSVIELVVIVTARVVDPLSNPTKPVEPKLVVPVLDSNRFDRAVHKEWRIGDPEPPAAASAPSPIPPTSGAGNGANATPAPSTPASSPAAPASPSTAAPFHTPAAAAISAAKADSR